jgi:predicted Zn finger-like uncharacterized protein
MDDRMMRVLCPQCGAGYRVDRDAVPAEGATASCRKCGRRFSITKSADGPASGSSGTPPAAAETPRETRFTCPRCGHRQTQPYNCYACGAAITPRESSPSAAEVPDAAAHASGAASPLGLVMGEIVVRTRFETSDWLLNFARPRVSLDGMEYHTGWGVHAFQVPDGDCTVVIDYKYFLKPYGRGTLNVHVSPAEKVYVDYRPRASSASAAVAIRKASTAEGLLWRIEPKSDRPSGKGMYSRKAVIISLIVMGPLGLYQLWKSEAFSTRVKIVITAVMVLLSYWVFSKLSLPTGSSLMPMR